MTTKIVACDCKHKDQDEMYGKGKRLMNKTTKGNPQQGHVWRCTVCKREHRA